MSAEDGSPFRAKVRTDHQQYQDQESSRDRGRDSIMNQASNLQQLLEKFSPLRGMSFENKYIQKKRQGRAAEAPAAARTRPERRTAPGARVIQQQEQADDLEDCERDQREPTALGQEESHADEGTSGHDSQEDGDAGHEDQCSLQEYVDEPAGAY